MVEKWDEYLNATTDLHSDRRLCEKHLNGRRESTHSQTELSKDCVSSEC